MLRLSYYWIRWMIPDFFLNNLLYRRTILHSYWIKYRKVTFRLKADSEWKNLYFFIFITKTNIINSIYIPFFMYLKDNPSKRSDISSNSLELSSLPYLTQNIFPFRIFIQLYLLLYDFVNPSMPQLYIHQKYQVNKKYKKSSRQIKQRHS